MSLTLGSGPFAAGTTAQRNFSLDAAPKHQILFQPDPRRFRAIVADEVVVDTVGGHLLHESNIPPRLYVPLADVRMDLFAKTATTTHCPFKGDASYWTLTVGDRTVEDVLWAYEDPLGDAPFLDGFGALYADRVDEWLIEEDRVLGHFKDPFHRVDAHVSSRPVEVRANGEVVARSERPVLIFETGLPARAYLPPADVHPAAIRPGTGKRTICPYKGEATYWTIAGLEDAAWSYESPLPDALRAQGHIAFDERVDGIEVNLGRNGDG
ncbi:MAG: hypothetical protein QOH43_778 [Solirubrobacteraceae bacterium]|jgi:uncharacterized protein (DUF427 family)|nr:hypothetical protein [Solirubrobacteraceae bacterium]